MRSEFRDQGGLFSTSTLRSPYRRPYAMQGAGSGAPWVIGGEVDLWCLRGILASCLLAACGPIQPRLATDPNALAPPSATTSWASAEAARIPGGKATLEAFSTRSTAAPPAIQAGRVYDLPHLIDLAQQTNPETRAVWQGTRAAAARLGIAEGAYLPTLSAIGMASYSRLPDYDSMGPFVVRTRVLEPLLRLEWLLLDFGRRAADVDSAAQTLLAANLQFNRRQQRVIFDVQKAYFKLESSRARVAAEETALKAATAVEEATDIRSGSGLASITDTLLARQLVLQQEFDITSARRDVHATEAQLAQAIGISPISLPQLASLSSLPLPEGLPASVNSLLQQAASTRPDLAAKFAEVRAREAELDRARADYLPKLSVNGTLGRAFRELEVLEPERQDDLSGTKHVERRASAQLGAVRRLHSRQPGARSQGATRSSKSRSRRTASREPSRGLDRLCQFPIGSLSASVRYCPRRHDKVRLRQCFDRLPQWHHQFCRPPRSRA